MRGLKFLRKSSEQNFKLQTNGPGPFSPRRCVTGEGVQNWTKDGEDGKGLRTLANAFKFGRVVFQKIPQNFYTDSTDILAKFT